MKLTKWMIVNLVLFLIMWNVTSKAIDKLDLFSIEPTAGPLSGNTRVLVRARDFTGYETKYPDPKWKFGRDDKIVEGAYVKCTPEPQKVWEMEPPTSSKTSTCIQCENAPPGFKAEIVPFTVSLTGDFSDIANSLSYRYYNDPKVWAIYPRYGEKDGGTRVDVWGDNFLNFEQFTRCGFGSKTVQAVFVNSNYMYCFSPASDVVEKGIPFIVTLNGQQSTKERVEFWYYPKPSIQSVTPNRGPDDGGNEVILTGNNFDPFRLYDINNHNDTFWKFEGLSLMPATVLESTKISCNAPPSYVNRQSIVEITLNNQQFTDNNLVYSYYKPPYIFDLDPRQGPTEGNTNVTIIGTNFKENVPFNCKFGDDVVKGEYISKSKVSCINPPHKKAEFVPVSIAFEKDLWSSGQTRFLYYDQPSISKIEPTCGPETGYTQITVYGENFINLGLGSVHWVFNRTVHMNATVMEHDIIKCDSPPAQGWFKKDTKGLRFYYLEITLDGKLYGGPPQKFYYYKDPDITGVNPIMGPIDGGTEVTISGVGFNQPATCNMTVRFGNIYTTPISYDSYQIKAKTPKVDVPNAVVVAVGINGQQFTKDKTLRYKDEENTFYYYENPIIYEFTPKKGLSNGGTIVTIRGQGFLPKKFPNGTFEETPVYLRMLESGSRKPLGPTTTAENVENEEIEWKVPPAPAGTKGIISLSLNNHQFYELYHTNESYSFEYLSSPFVESIDPEFGEVRHAESMTLDVHGKNFDCPSEGCDNVKCKFGSDPDEVIVKGQRISSELIKCPLPNYPQPDVLDVEVSMNGKDYSNNGKQFGYYDPFVLHADPKLISKSGSTRVEIKGFGFVDSTKVGGLKVMYDNDASSYYCTKNKNKWVVDASYVDKNKISAPTLPFDMLQTENGDKIEDSDPIDVEVSVFKDEFTNNHIKVNYYEDPVFLSVSPEGAPANTQSPIMTKTNFNFDVNDPDIFMEYAVIKCRFTSLDGAQVIYTDGRAVTYPFQIGANPTHIKWNTPVWPLGGREKERVKLDITTNGYDYSGNFDFSFSDNLEIYRVAPLSGPNEGGTDVRFVGSGFEAKDHVEVKWGVGKRELKQGESAKYSGNHFEDELDYGDSIQSIMPIHQRPIELDKTYDSLKLMSPKLSNWHKTYGGPVYLEVGAKQDIENKPSSNLDKFSYTTSFTEYYYYKEPVVKNIHPHGGPIEGGTDIVIEGSDFQFMPEYGVEPYCQIGDKVVKAEFESTVRIVCTSPPGDSIDSNYPLKVSLNGENFFDTGKFFHYYQNSEIQTIRPASGPNTGGTTIRLSGEHFSDLSNQNEFLCRFQPLNKDIPPKYISARYFNQTTVLCASPGGFGNVDAVNVDLSFNGIDYTDSGQEFRYYNIITASPRSGPADGVGENILVQGQGFKDDGNVKCRLDNTEYLPDRITWDEISCPVIPAKQGKDYFGNVPFEVSVNGDDWHSFTGGFQYYEQPTVHDIYPKSGPNVGHGKIKFYGDKFREDFQLAETYCRVGDSYGKAKVIDQKSMECEITELPLSGKEEGFPAQISLNNASWTKSNKNTIYTPYGIHHITPNSGPSKGGTEITVYGSGFDIRGSSPRCRFGVPGNYAIVNGKALSHDKMVCNSPDHFSLPRQAALPFSVPFSIALNKDDTDPWTQSAHRFRFYQQPRISGCTPTTSEIGTLQNVNVFASQGSEFVQPIPIEDSQYSDYGIFCKFGKFGVTPGALYNSSMIKCTTPTIQERPESVDKETVVLSVAQNGQNFNEDYSSWDYTFTGTGTGTSFWPWILALILIFILLIALLLCLAAILQRNSYKEPRRAQGAFVEREAPHVLNRRPRGVPSGHMEYDSTTRRDTGGLFPDRSDFRGTDPYDPRANRDRY